MIKKFFIIYIFLLLSQINAQNLDSLYNEFLYIKGIASSKKITLSESNNKEKCGFGIINTVKKNFQKFSEKQKQVLSSLLQRPTTDTSIVSPKGKFRIHFNKAGYNKPGYDINELARAADSAYNFEVNILKYPPAPVDNGAGGDNLYDIYIQNLVSGLYGYTELETKLVGETYSCFTVIDNDFTGGDYATSGIMAAKATVAHEYHHAIQIGNYIWRESDLFYYEITSTAMEEFVFDDVNDYLTYLDSYFNNPAKAINLQNGYNLSIWNIFLKDRFGYNIIKDIWQLMPLKRAVECFNDVLLRNNSSLKNEFNTFGIWTYFTNTRSIPGKYFREAKNFPLVKPTFTQNFSQNSITIKTQSEPISNNFIEITDGPNKITTIISNIDIENSVSGTNKSLPYDFTLSTKSNSNYRYLGFGYYTYIESLNKTLIAESNIINDILVNEGKISIEVVDYAFPQPFSYAKHNNLYLPATLNTENDAEVFIYSSSMNLVYSGQKRIVASEKISVAWDGLDNNNKKLPTGVYFYIVKCGDEIKKGKIVIQND